MDCPVIRACALVLLSSAAAAGAQNDFLGTSIQLRTVIVNTSGCSDTDTDQGVRVVGPGVEYPSLLDGPGTGTTIPVAVDIDSDSIVIDFSGISTSGTFCAGDENTYVFLDPDGSIPRIVGVTIDTDLTTLDVEASDLAFGDDTIRLNVEGLAFSPASFVRLLVEFDVCIPDANGDGLLTPADFNAWILAFNNNAPECDQNGDGLCTPADFNAWILNYNAGCD